MVKTNIKYVHKSKCERCKNKFVYVYSIRRVGFRYRKSRTNLEKLKEAVIKDNMPWEERGKETEIEKLIKEKGRQTR